VSNTNTYGKRLLSIKIAATAKVSLVGCSKVVQSYRYGKRLGKINAWPRDIA
jgi:hypothetical protein